MYEVTMSVQLITNNAEAPLNSEVTIGATSFVLSSGYGSLFPFPTVGENHFFVRFGTNATNEVVRCTERVIDTITCEALTMEWPAGTEVALTASKESMSDFVQKDGVQLLEKKKFQGVKDNYQLVTISTNTLTINYRNGCTYSVIIDQDINNIVIQNGPGITESGGFTIRFLQDGAGSHAIVFSGSLFDWNDSDGPPDITQAATGEDILVFLNFNGESKWKGGAFGLNFG